MPAQHHHVGKRNGAHDGSVRQQYAPGSDRIYDRGRRTRDKARSTTCLAPENAESHLSWRAIDQNPVLSEPGDLVGEFREIDRLYDVAVGA